MKTTGFGSLKLEVKADGTCMVTAFSPTLGHFELPMSGDELMIFLVEAGNELSECRKVELKKRQEDELRKEGQRC